VKGTVNVAFAAGSWTDAAGNLGVAETQSFYLTEPPAVSDPAEEPDPESTSYRVFFIELSGGMELRFADLFDEPILEIRGKVALEFGNRPIGDGQTKARIALFASGTIKVIKLGNLASGAATFVSRWGTASATSSSGAWRPSPPTSSSWNSTGSTSPAARSCRSTPPAVRRPRRSRSRASRVAWFSPWMRRRRRPVCLLARSTKWPSPTPGRTSSEAGTDRDLDGVLEPSDTLVSLLAGNGMTYKLENFAGLTDAELTDAQVECINPGVKWKVYLKDGRYFFIEKTTSVALNDLGEQTSSKNVFMIKGEKRTYELAPLSFSLEVVGGLRIQPAGSVRSSAGRRLPHQVLARGSTSSWRLQARSSRWD
jgi:hypothetical protein